MGVGIELDGGVAVVTIDRQDALNAFDRELLAELHEHLSALARDEEVRVVVLTGAGEKAFAAGADIKYMSGLSVAEAMEWGTLGHDTARLLETMPKPTIAAINGFALGGGCELALACDIRYAATTARIGQPELNLALIPGWGGTQRLARVCGLGVAKDLVLTGRPIDAAEALRVGLVSAVFEPDDLLERALETARRLAAMSTVALRAAKQALNVVLQGSHDANLEHEAACFAELFDSEDAKEGMQAFAEKRAPRFTGR